MFAWLLVCLFFVFNLNAKFGKTYNRGLAPSCKKVANAEAGLKAQKAAAEEARRQLHAARDASRDAERGAGKQLRAAQLEHEKAEHALAARDDQVPPPSPLPPPNRDWLVLFVC